MDKSKFNFSVNKNLKGTYHIADFFHSEDPSDFYEINEKEKEEMIETMVSFIKGEISNNTFVNKIWSDGDPEEASFDCYVAINKFNGKMSDIIVDMGMLVAYLHKTDWRVYRIIIDDNLI